MTNLDMVVVIFTSVLSVVKKVTQIIYWFILHCISKTTLLYDRGHNDLVVKVIDNHRQPLLFDHVFPGVLHVLWNY
jgi:hypothetical protein